MDSELTLLLLVIGVMAVLYSSVGHGGASGYLAAMAVFGLAPEIMRPAALLMNLAVASLVLWRMARVERFDWSLFRPLALASIPMAYLGGTLALAGEVYRIVIGILLLLAALLMIRQAQKAEYTLPASLFTVLLAGAGLGFVSGLTGIGGGVYLSPLLLFLHWTDMRGSVAMAALFIWVNSASGLFGVLAHAPVFTAEIWLMVLVAVMGAALGSELAARHFSPARLRHMLGLVLLIAGLHSLFSG